MKALQCELCGGKLTMRSGGLAVCEYCGMEYTSDRIRERIQEITGTVRIDNSHMVNNYLDMTKTALDAHNYNEAASYVNKAIEIEPGNYWAWYLKGVASSNRDEKITCLKKAIELAPEDTATQLRSNASTEYIPAFKKALSDQFDFFVQISGKDESKSALNALLWVKHYAEKMRTECGLDTSCWSNWIVPMTYKAVCAAWDNVCSEYNEHSDSAFFWEKLVDVGKISITILEEVLALSGGDYAFLLKIYHKASDIADSLIYSKACDYVLSQGRYIMEQRKLGDNDRNNLIQKQKKYAVSAQQIKVQQQGYAYLAKTRITVEQFSKVAKYVMADNWEAANNLIKKLCKCNDRTVFEITHNFTTMDFLNPQSDLQQGGCYIATAVYGSYDCPQVWTLRRFRDEILAQTWYGRMFIHVYYALSPSVVKYFGKVYKIKRLWQFMLDPLVERLNADGIKNTPYTDRKW